MSISKDDENIPIPKPESENLVKKVIFAALLILLFIFIIWVIQNTRKMLVLPDFYKNHSFIEENELSKVGKTGDLLLFSDTQQSKVITTIRRFLQPHEGADFTHSGVLYIDPITKIPYVWEAIPIPEFQPWRDVISGKQKKNGAQLLEFHEKMATYKGYCTLVSLSSGIETMDVEFRTIMDAYKNVLFAWKKSWIAVAMANTLFFNISPETMDKIHKIIGGDRFKDGIICSELTILTYYHLGAWPNDPKSINNFLKKLTTVFPQNLLLDGCIGKFKAEKMMIVKT